MHFSGGLRDACQLTDAFECKQSGCFLFASQCFLHLREASVKCKVVYKTRQQHSYYLRGIHFDFAAGIRLATRRFTVHHWPHRP